MMKIYTKTGDDGTTGLFGGERVAKHSPRIEAVGAIDEFNAALAIGRSECAHLQSQTPSGSIHEIRRIDDILGSMQHTLFDLGAQVATPAHQPGKTTDPEAHESTAKEIVALEGTIDEIDGELPELRQFILPGGTELASRLHMARAVARRAERRAVTLIESFDTNDEHTRADRERLTQGPLVYLNRASALLFVLARYANKVQNHPDVPWRGM